MSAVPAGTSPFTLDGRPVSRAEFVAHRRAAKAAATRAELGESARAARTTERGAALAAAWAKTDAPAPAEADTDPEEG